MRLKDVVLALLSTSVILGGWGLAQGVDPELRNLEARWQEAQNSGNLADIAELFTEDAWFSPFDGSTLEGIEAIRAFFTAEEGSPGGGPRIEISPEEHTVAGELAYGYGTYALWAPDGSQIASGNYLGVYRQERGEWRIYRYMGNASMPEGAQEDSARELPAARS